VTLFLIALAVMTVNTVGIFLAHRAGQRQGYDQGYGIGRRHGIRAVLDGMAARTPGLRDDVARALAAGQDPTEIPTDRGDH
jgi:predicted dienelactone hydrolase